MERRLIQPPVRWFEIIPREAAQSKCAPTKSAEGLSFSTSMFPPARARQFST
jgi:hypothetical protein